VSPQENIRVRTSNQFLLMMRAYVVLFCCSLALVLLLQQQQQSVLIQLLPQSQIASAIQLFSRADTEDKNMEHSVGITLKGDDHRTALAQEKLMRDQVTKRA